MTALGNHSRSEWPPIETALRWLGKVAHGEPVDILQHAIERPAREAGIALAPLTRPTAALEGWSPHERAEALRQLIVEGIHDPDVSPTELSRELNVLRAAFRLPHPDRRISAQWRGSLAERFKQLRVLADVFGDPVTTQPMEKSWKEGVALLANYLEQRFHDLAADSAGWAKYRRTVEWPPPKPPSSTAQPVAVDLLITTVFLKDRAFHRRITERLVTAMEDGVDHYVTRSRPPLNSGGRTVKVGAAWGCRVDPLPLVRYGEHVARLYFPRLDRGRKHWFATELVSTDLADDRPWVAVRIDSWGIAAGKTTEEGIPVRGLTVRIVFEDGDHPVDAWYYTDPTARQIAPPPGDPHRLPMENLAAEGMLSHTFAEPSGPRDEVGLAFRWGDD